MYQVTTYKNYTPQLRELVECGYPVFNEWWNTYIPEHKKELESKIIHTYYFNQIGCDEPDRFKFYLNSQLERIMPYYNQLYKSELIKFDPILNQYLETHSRTIDNLIREMENDKSEIGKRLRDFAKSATGNTDTIGNLSSNYTETTNKTGERTDEKTGTTEDTQNVSGTTTDDSESNGTNKRDTTGSGNSTTDETGSVTTTGSKLYSDTPQRDISGNINTNYLTNYTETSENQNRDLTTTNEYSTTENVTGEDTNTTSSKGTSTEETTKNGEYKENVTINTTEDEKTTRTNGEDTTGNQKTDSFENGKEDVTNNVATVENNKEKSTKDSGENRVISGFTNVSPSSLLSAFRETFLNIDEMIIKDLAENFMMVF